MEHAAASVRTDKTCHEKKAISLTHSNSFKQIQHLISNMLKIALLITRSYPVSRSYYEQYSRLTNRAFNQNRVPIHQRQSETPWDDQAHDCYQIAEMLMWELTIKRL